MSKKIKSNSLCVCFIFFLLYIEEQLHFTSVEVSLTPRSIQSFRKLAIGEILEEARNAEMLAYHRIHKNRRKSSLETSSASIQAHTSHISNIESKKDIQKAQDGTLSTMWSSLISSFQSSKPKQVANSDKELKTAKAEEKQDGFDHLHDSKLETQTSGSGRDSIESLQSFFRLKSENSDLFSNTSIYKAGQRPSVRGFSKLFGNADKFKDDAAFIRLDFHTKISILHKLFVDRDSPWIKWLEKASEGTNNRGNSSFNVGELSLYGHLSCDQAEFSFCDELNETMFQLICGGCYRFIEIHDQSQTHTVFVHHLCVVPGVNYAEKYLKMKGGVDHCLVLRPIQPTISTFDILSSNKGTNSKQKNHDLVYSVHPDSEKCCFGSTYSCFHPTLIHPTGLADSMQELVLRYLLLSLST